MAICPTCNSGCDDRALFCLHCGSLPRKKEQHFWGGSILLAVVLFGLVGTWKFVVLLPPTTSTERVVPVPPDEAAIFISKCGYPDSDKLANDTVQPENATRSLLYQKARVKVVFGHPFASQQGWELRAMLDPRTLKQLTADKLKKRLPCSTVQDATSDMKHIPASQ